jgi:hypothetical protein
MAMRNRIIAARSRFRQHVICETAGKIDTERVDMIRGDARQAV